MKTWQKLKQNPALFERYFVKEYMIKAIRKFFENRNYHELESPIITSALPQERYLDVLETHIGNGADDLNAYLIPSTETFNKKILVAGLGNHFVITKVARGLEEIGPNHSPEFTMLEWYELGHTYFDLMDSCEKLFLEIKKYIDEKFDREFSPIIKYKDQEIDLSTSWDRISVPEALEKYVAIKLENIQDINDFRKVAQTLGYNVGKDDDWQTIFELIFSDKIETQFAPDKPTFVYDYPRILCPLTKPSATNPLVSQKVELYLTGREIGNGYTELTDWEIQKKNFDEEQKARKLLGKSEIKYDEDLIEAMKAGMPEVSGIGIGLDRLAMIFANAESIADINYFPASEMFE